MPSRFETYVAALSRRERTALSAMYARELRKQMMREALGFNPETGRLYDVHIVGEPAPKR